MEGRVARTVAARDPLVSRMHGFGTSVFAEMSALAVRTGSINLGQGFPDTDGPPELLEAAVKAIRAGHNQYPPGPGIPELRRAVAAHQEHWYGQSVDPDTEVLITAGATEATTAAVLALAGPGDEVVFFEPYFDTYPAAVALAGATRRVVALRRERDADRGQDRWTFDPDELRAAITPRTRLILLNTPHNPTGKVFDAAELQTIADLAVEHDLLVLTDEVYEHLVFDGQHRSLATLPGMAERTLTAGSAGKTFSVTGWKIGWLIAAPSLITAVRTIKQMLTYVNGAPFQPAVAMGLGLPDAYFTATAAALRERRDQLCTGLAAAGFDVIVPQATYFAMADVGRDGVEFCRALPAETGVVAIPGSVFYDSSAGDQLIRFAFCKRPEILAEAVRRLTEAARGGRRGNDSVTTGGKSVRLEQDEPAAGGRGSRVTHQ